MGSVSVEKWYIQSQAWAGHSWHKDDLSSGQHKEAECNEAHDEDMVARWEIGIAITSGAKDLCNF